MGWRSILGRAGAVAVGVLWGFFGALNVAFSDSGSRAEFVEAVALVSLIYGVLSFAAGILGPKVGWEWGLWIGLPGVAMLAVYSFMERAGLLNDAIVACAAMFASCGGATLGSAVRRPRR